MDHDEAMRAGLRKIVREYGNPPQEGVLVPRAWVEDMIRPELLATVRQGK